MFQFSTTNVINSADRFATTDDGLLVKGVNTFKKANVTNIFKATAVNASNESVKINLGKITGAKSGEAFRLVLNIGLTQGSADARYANDTAFKGLPMSIDFVWKADAATTAAALEKTIKKHELLVYGEKVLTASVNSAELTLTAVNEYQRFKVVNVEKFDATAHGGMGTYNVVEAEGLVTKTPGVEGFGTYSYLLHNLRLPTDARTNAFAIHQDEAPIVGALYDQYTIHYCVDRGPLGLNAVGDSVKSATVHVFYVHQSVSSNFAGKLGALGTVTEVPEAAEGTSVLDGE